MGQQYSIMLAGLALAAFGHLLVHNVRPAAAVWTWLDGRFPPSLRSAPSLAGPALLALGAVGVLGSALS